MLSYPSNFTMIHHLLKGNQGDRILQLFTSLERKVSHPPNRAPVFLGIGFPDLSATY